jgi:hypothetical protein
MRYLEDGKVVEIVDLLTGKILMEQEKTRQLQEHSRHVHEQRGASKCVSKRRRNRCR